MTIGNKQGFSETGIFTHQLVCELISAPQLFLQLSLNVKKYIQYSNSNGSMHHHFQSDSLLSLNNTGKCCCCNKSNKRSCTLEDNI